MAPVQRTLFSSLHHLFFITGALCCGIITQARYILLPTLPAGIITFFTGIVLLGALSHHGRSLLWLLLPCAFLCGGLRYQKQLSNHANVNKVYQGYHHKLIGTLIEKEKIQHLYMRERLTLALIENPTVHIYIFTPCHIAATIGDTLLLRNSIISPQTSNKYQSFLTKENITFSLFLKKDSHYQVIALGTPSLKRFLHNQRNRLI
jgi:hypothetical protein